MKAQFVLSRRRWYGSVRIFRDGRMRFNALAYKDAGHVTILDGPPFPVSVSVSGRQVLLMYPRRGRVASACFVFTLTAAELRHAVDALRRATGGLEGWVVPALESTQQALGGTKNPTPERRELLAAIAELLESCRDLAVSEVWRRHRRETQKAWVKHLRTHPEDISQVTTPWMLPEGFTLPAPTEKRPRTKRRRSRSSISQKVG